MMLTTAITVYLETLEQQQTASPETRARYQAALDRFARFATDRYGSEPTLEQITEEDLRSYLHTLVRQALRAWTIRKALLPIRRLFTLAVERGYRSDNPAAEVWPSMLDPVVRQAVSDEELEQLLAGCGREPDSRRRAMLRALLAVLIYTGVRRRELLDLLVSDVDLAGASLKVQNPEGTRARSLPICQPCLAALRAWLAVRPKAVHPYLFLTDSQRRLGQVGLTRLIEAAKSLADLREHCNIAPHTIRHTAAVRMLRRGEDLSSIQRFMGDANIRTTAMYLRKEHYLDLVQGFLGEKPAPRRKRRAGARRQPQRPGRDTPLRRRRRPG